jgi:rubrerythrin
MHGPTETEAQSRPSAVAQRAGDPSSRKRFLEAAGGTGAAGAVALFLAACGTKKQKLTPGGSNANTAAGSGTDQYGKGDLGIARYALTLEYIESMFYAQLVSSGKLSGKAAALARRFGAEENQHVKALEGVVSTLGGQPPARPKAQFPGGSPQTVIQFALSLESLGAAAYLGQVDRIQDRKLLAATLSITSVESRHAAALASLLGQDPSPEGAFSQPAAAADVLNQLHSLVAV